MAAAHASLGSFVCSACGGLVPEARRREHAMFWCPRGSHDHPDQDDDCAKDCAGVGRLSAAVRALLTPQFAPEIPVGLSFLPGVRLRVAQQADDPQGGASQDAEHYTGGQLWWSELVLSELLVLSSRGPPRSGPPRRHAAVALGCGAAPVSAFTAAALGWEVLCTDLEEVLPMTRRNAACNAGALDLGFATVGPATRLPSAERAIDRIAFAALPFGEPLRDEVQRWLRERGGAQLVLCSDCIWQAHRHRPLASTLAQLLGGAPNADGDFPSGVLADGAGGAALDARISREALVAFQHREGDESAFFPKLAEFGLRSQRLDAEAAARLVRLPHQFLSSGDPARGFSVHRVWRADAAAAPCAQAAAARPRAGPAAVAT